MGEEDEEPVSGPYCRHYYDPADCDELCPCGHTCSQHTGSWAPDPCSVCSCQQFGEVTSPWCKKYVKPFTSTRARSVRCRPST